MQSARPNTQAERAACHKLREGHTGGLENGNHVPLLTPVRAALAHIHACMHEGRRTADAAVLWRARVFVVITMHGDKPTWLHVGQTCEMREHAAACVHALVVLLTLGSTPGARKRALQSATTMPCACRHQAAHTAHSPVPQPSQKTLAAMQMWHHTSSHPAPCNCRPAAAQCG